MNYVCGVFNFAISRWWWNSPNKSLANINEFTVYFVCTNSAHLQVASNIVHPVSPQKCVWEFMGVTCYGDFCSAEWYITHPISYSIALLYIFIHSVDSSSWSFTLIIMDINHFVAKLIQCAHLHYLVYVYVMTSYLNDLICTCITKKK